MCKYSLYMYKARGTRECISEYFTCFSEILPFIQAKPISNYNFYCRLLRVITNGWFGNFRSGGTLAIADSFCMGSEDKILVKDLNGDQRSDLICLTGKYDLRIRMNKYGTY